MTSSIGRILLPAFAVLGVSFLASAGQAAPQALTVAPSKSVAVPVGYRSRGHGGHRYRGYSRRSYGSAYRYRGRGRGRGYGYGHGRRYGYGGAYAVKRLLRGFGYYGRSRGGYRPSYGYRSHGYRPYRSYGGYGYGYRGHSYR